MNYYYRLGSNLYVNITNLCHCDCLFCIRGRTNSVGDAESLWLSHEPSLQELMDAFDNRKKEHKEAIGEVVFCGYGEPLERADVACLLARHIKNSFSHPIRLNTNGLVGLIEPSFELGRLSVFDRVSISLNADTSEEYLRITRPSFGQGSFEAMLEFAKTVSEITNVQFTVVETLEPLRQKRCEGIAEKLGIPLVVRSLM